MKTKEKDKKFKRKRLKEIVIMFNDGEALKFTNRTHFIALDDYTNIHIEPLNPPRGSEFKILRYSYAYESYILIHQTNTKLIDEYPVYPVAYSRLAGTDVDAYDEDGAPLKQV